MGVYDEIQKERAYQDSRFGTEFDDKNTANDWASYIARYASNASFSNSYGEWRKQMIKVAAIAVAAVEAFDRNGGSLPPRHYDHTNPTAAA